MVFHLLTKLPLLIPATRVAVTGTRAVVTVGRSLAASSSTREDAWRFFVSSRNALDNINKNKDEISSDPDILHFVEQYHQINIDNRRLFTAIKDFLRRSREADRLLREAVFLFEKCHNPQAALQKLREFKEVGNPLTKEFIEEFNLMGERLNSTWNALCHLKEKLDQKLLSVTAWRMIWNIAYNAAFMAVSICSAVLSALDVTGTAVTVLHVTAAVRAPLKKVIDWMWDAYQTALERKIEAMETLKDGTGYALYEFNCIRDLLGELDIKLNSRICAVESAIEEKEEAALKDAMFEINHNAESVEDLENQIDLHAAELNNAISELHTITSSIYKKSGPSTSYK